MTSILHTPHSTRAAVIDGYGGPERLVVADISLPELTESQALVAVAAVSVNPVDLTTRQGRNIPESDARFPMVLGWDVAGTVLAVGRSVTDVAVGDRVAAMVFQPLDQRGTYAAHVVLDVELLAQIPEGLSLQQAATVPLAGMTAFQLVEEIRSDEVKTLVVTGALGAVGRHVVTLASRAGLDVFAAVATERADEALALGASEALERGGFADAVLERFPGGVDAAIDLVGGTSSHAAFDVVREGGRFATAVPTYVDSSGRFEDGKGIEIYVHTVHPDTPRLTELLALAEDGLLHTAIEASYPLEEAAEAHRRQSAGRLSGRVQIVP